MKTRTFELFSSINCNEIGSEDWGLVRDGGKSEDFFGWETKECVGLEGDWLYVYAGGNGIVLTDGDDDPIVPDEILHCVDSDRAIQLYRI